MKQYALYFATNRNHLGPDQWNPTGYGDSFSDDGQENLRFGYLTVNADEAFVNSCLNANVNGLGNGDGLKLASFFTGLASSASIQAYQENLNKTVPDFQQPTQNFGSDSFFKDLKSEMSNGADVIVYIHGFNNSWDDCVGGALSLQALINSYQSLGKMVIVVLFSWPSQKGLIPFYSYWSDRAAAKASGYAVGRGFLRLRDFLNRLYAEVRNGTDALCGQSIHLLCHSMGNFALQNALERIEEFTLTPGLPRVFENIFMCSPAVADTVLESGQPMERLNELTRSISVYYNRDDKAIIIGDTTKSTEELLGHNGCAHPYLLHSKVNQIDCTGIVPGGLFDTKHGYFLLGDINRDIAQTIAGVMQNDKNRMRDPNSELPNTWKMR